MSTSDASSAIPESTSDDFTARPRAPARPAQRIHIPAPLSLFSLLLSTLITTSIPSTSTTSPHPPPLHPIPPSELVPRPLQALPARCHLQHRVPRHQRAPKVPIAYAWRRRARGRRGEGVRGGVHIRVREGRGRRGRLRAWLRYRGGRGSCGWMGGCSRCCSRGCGNARVWVAAASWSGGQATSTIDSRLSLRASCCPVACGTWTILVSARKLDR